MLKEVYGRKYDNNVQAQTIRKQVRPSLRSRPPPPLAQPSHLLFLPVPPPPPKLKSKYDDGAINVDNFTTFVRTHPAILFPAFELQTNIQKHILGSEFWRTHAETRLHLSNGEYVSINQILKAHINDAAFNDLVMSNAVVDSRASRQDSMVKEQIKGAFKTSGLSGERKFKSSASRLAHVPSMSVVAAAAAAAGGGDPQPPPSASASGAGTPKRRPTLKGAAGAVVAAQRLSRRPRSLESQRRERSARSGREKSGRERRTGEFKVQRPGGEGRSRGKKG